MFHGSNCFDSTENIVILGNVIAEYGTVVRMWMGTQLTILLTGPEDLEVYVFQFLLIIN